MVINLKTSINNVVDEDNIFSFDISIFDLHSVLRMLHRMAKIETGQTLAR